MTDDVDALRKHLADNNGIAGLEVLDPHEIERAVSLFHRDGFVVVRDALDADQLASMRAGCDRVIDEMLALDPDRDGNRGSNRYSFGAGSSTGHQVHNPEWQMLLDLPTVTPIVTAIFDSPDYILRGGGGDFCLPGATEYQALHADIDDRIAYKSFVFGSFHEPDGALTIRDLPVPNVTCNFLMVDFTELNGPTRQIPGTQRSREPIPGLDDEPEWMRLSTVCPAPAGSVLIRDVRAWHGGTPNLSDEIRAIPNIEFWAPWYREPITQYIDRADWEGFSDHAKRIALFSTLDSSERLEQHPVLGWTPPGLRTPPAT